MSQRVQIPSTFDHYTYKMSSKSHCSSLCPGTVLSVLSLLLYSAGFIRVEVKFNDHEERLIAVEEVISHMKQGMADTLIKGKVCLDFFPLKLIGVSSVNCVCILRLIKFRYEWKWHYTS